MYSDYIGFEDEARSIANYESLFVPGLLQTEAYARAQLRGTLPHATEAEIEGRVAARLERHPVLVKADAPIQSAKIYVFPVPAWSSCSWG